MASSSSASAAAYGLPPAPPPPKILLTKPPSAAAATVTGATGDDDPAGSGAAAVRSRNAPQPGSLHLVSFDTWDLHIDKILPFLTENNDFMVIGIIGPPGVGKSTIMNELYGYDGSSPGMLPSFATQSDEIRATAKHCTSGIELRVSNERLILLDAQPVFSSSILVDMMRPDGLSSISVLNGESISADLAHELMGIQLGVFLASVCNILLVVSEGINDFTMWQLMLTVDLLKHNIPDPSLLVSSPSQASISQPDKEYKNNIQPSSEEYIADLCFVHTRLRDQDFSPTKLVLLRKALSQYFNSSSFRVGKTGETSGVHYFNPPSTRSVDTDSPHQDIFFLPTTDNSAKYEVGSYSSMLGMLRDQVLSRTPSSFSKNISERDWLRSSAKIWDLVKKSPVIADYCKTLQNSGLFRK